MKFLWMFALLFSIQPLDHEDNLYITYEGNPIANINRLEYRIPNIEVPVLDEEKYNTLIEYLDKQIYKQPVDAKINESGGIVQEEVGTKLNRRKFLHMFYEYFFSQGTSTIEIPTQYIYPRVDSELLVSIRTKQIGRYVTYFNSYSKERSHNISLAAEAINNHVVFPNETFSFNKVVGKRTKEKGYQPAPEIVRGELTEGIGGGICQVSSTLFNAVDKAGMKIVRRYSHSKRVPYVPPGRDATVSWYGPDFLFRNDYNQPILLRAKAKDGMLIISVYSSEEINYQPRVIKPGQ